MHKFILILLIAAFFNGLVGCNSSTFYNTTTDLETENWNSEDPILFSFEVSDSTKPYDLELFLRHSGEYEYSNVFFLMHIVQPDSVVNTERLEFTLAQPDGEWLGSGLGDIYDIVLPVQNRFVFPRKGKYSIVIEQNMRQDPLKGIKSVGIKITESKSEE